HELKDLF
ncbi:hypothetical protein Tco_1064903, partial [Tanacetum coccineum]